jgi:outer membrane protein assembly factor BamB
MEVYRFCIIACLFLVIFSPSVTAVDTMFRADPQHTGIFDGRGVVNSNISVWRFVTGGVVSSSPAIADGSVFFGSDDGNLYAVDAATGEEKWHFLTGKGVASSPAIVQGVVYAGSYDNNLYAVDAVTGRERWRFKTASFVTSSPTVSDGIVYFGSDDDHLYAVNAATGTVKWAFATESDVSSTPAVSGGMVFVGSNDKNLYAINTATGMQQWEFRTRSYIQSSPAVGNGIVYVGSNDNNVYALDAMTGTEKWRFATGGAVTSSPAVSQGVVYVGSHDTNLYAVDAVSGRERWRFATGNIVSSSPAIADGVIYFGSLDGRLYAIDAVTGIVNWQFSTGRGIYSSPAVADGMVYVGSYDKNLYAVGGKSAAAILAAAAIPTAVSTLSGTQVPLTVITPVPPVNGVGDLPVLPDGIMLLAAVLLTGAGGFLLLQYRKSPEKNSENPPPVTTSGREPVSRPVTGQIPSSAPDAVPPVPGRDIETPSDTATPPSSVADPGRKRPAQVGDTGTPLHGQPVQIPVQDSRQQPDVDEAGAAATPEPLPPASDPFPARLLAIQTRAATLALFFPALAPLVTRSQDLYRENKKDEALKAAEEAESATESLAYCESELALWKEEGYECARLELLKAERAETIISAFRAFEQAVLETEKIQKDLEIIKRRHPSVIMQAGFPAAVSSLEHNLTQPDNVRTAGFQFRQLTHDIELFIQDQERRERHIRNGVSMVREKISDPTILTKTERVITALRSGDVPAAELLFRELAADQASLLHEREKSMRDNGVVIPADLSAFPEPESAEYAAHLLRIMTRLRNLDSLQELFTKATVMREMVKDKTLLLLYDQGRYEEFIKRCEEEAQSAKNKPLIFISAKSEDYEYAERVRTFLTDHGCRVFFSEKTLPETGNTEFGEEIDTALENSRHIIIVTSSREHVTSKWVKSEWRVFLDEKRAGRKTGNIITILAGSMRIEDLPIGLRNYETKFLNDPKTLEQILNYLN